MSSDNLAKSKVISARIKGENLLLFNQLDVSPTELFKYGLKKFSEENIIPERLSLMSKIEEVNEDIRKCELELASKKSALESLEKELRLLEDS